jgi:hypothetical protein
MPRRPFYSLRLPMRILHAVMTVALPRSDRQAVSIDDAQGATPSQEYICDIHAAGCSIRSSKRMRYRCSHTRFGKSGMACRDMRGSADRLVFREQHVGPPEAVEVGQVIDEYRALVLRLDGSIDLASMCSLSRRRVLADDERADRCLC